MPLPAPGERLAIIMKVTPKAGMHLYAPGEHGYQVVGAHARSTAMVATTDHALSTVRDLSLQAAQRERRGLHEAFPAAPRCDATGDSGGAEAVWRASERSPSREALEYQACDDKVCFNPARVPVSFVVRLRELDRRPPS